MLPRTLVLTTAALSALLLTPPLYAQTEEPAEPAEETETTASETPTEETIPEVEETPTSLEALAAADPNLELIEGEGDEPDAMVMMADVLFTFGSSTLSDEALASLTGLADHLEEYPTVEIQGYTDSVGSENANEALGQLRADSVGDWLAANSNMPADRILTSSLGETAPAAANENEDGSDNPEGRALNRRVVFLFPEA